MKKRRVAEGMIEKFPRWRKAKGVKELIRKSQPKENREIELLLCLI